MIDGLDKILIQKVLYRFRNMNAEAKAHMIIMALSKPEWMKKTYPEVFN